MFHLKSGEKRLSLVGGSHQMSTLESLAIHHFVGTTFQSSIEFMLHPSCTIVVPSTATADFTSQSYCLDKPSLMKWEVGCGDVGYFRKYFSISTLRIS